MIFLFRFSGDSLNLNNSFLLFPHEENSSQTDINVSHRFLDDSEEEISCDSPSLQLPSFDMCPLSDKSNTNIKGMLSLILFNTRCENLDFAHARIKNHALKQALYMSYKKIRFDTRARR